MSPEMGFRPVVEDDSVEEYAFAMEYNGPPLSFDIPRAVPINIESIPLASVVTQIPYPEKISLPIINPVLAPDGLNKNFSRELNKVGSGNTNVSPTSVIDFERITSVCEHERDVELASEATLSPTSVDVFEKREKSGQECIEMGDVCSSGTLEDLNCRGESGDWSGLINSSAELASSSISHEHSRDLVGRGGSSCPSEYCESFEKLRELSAVSEASMASGPSQDNLDADDLNGREWSSTKSVLSMEYLSSSLSSFRTGECKSMPHNDVKRPIVTFRDSDSYDDVDEELVYREVERLRPMKEALPRSKKGVCYRCLKGNRFTEKEACIVCNAKYCSNCVLKAMGSMPEGRKCVACIGYSIDESKRENLGKCSKILKRLLNDLEIRQILKAEKLCDVNQLPPEYICVNGKPLCHEELLLLQTCLNPPKNIKPGNYWYDKVSGLWGKEGDKPSQIISPHLNVGDPIKPDASNGNTRVYINGREITKPELRMLQLAGVQCAGNPHFWVNDDGSYQEEGQKNTKGYIWGKAGMKLVCAFLSLPVPSRSKNPCTEEVRYDVERPIPDYMERSLQKLLLVGNNGSGTSTIFKQAKILYKTSPFSEDEREKIKLMIQGNVYGYLGMLLEGRERFEEESLMSLPEWSSDTVCQQERSTQGSDEMTIYSICPRLKEFSDWLLKTMASGNLEAIFPAATREYAPLVEELWNTSAIQVTYNRRSELEMLPSVASYFLERVVDILQPDYEPSDLDILYAEGVTSSNGLACVEFSFPQSADDDIDSTDQHGSLPRYQLIRVHAKGFAENCKWLDMLEDARLVIFCVALTDYDQFSYDSEGTPVNNMLQSKKLFESIVTHPTFEQMDFHLILNKFDLFDEKIEQIPLSECEWFEDFQPVISQNSKSFSSSRSRSINHNPSLGQLGFHYIAVKFKKLYFELTGRKLFVSSVKGLEPDSVDAALKYAREIVKWEDERINFSLSEYAIYSTEASFSSH
ncbi:extra-large guanine nucleotide-binding protein 1-like [Chenopodium quinoa]|uniref:extra-large guanine nucleotide-binding protein 1-like n=1 Tax=Chenopodium quinoa TaxID=63459 RepID=UPI000B76F9C9|nr:extra-large guanine nucleotide-binding protein 1-like [Chenopodium quinoa]